MIDFPRKVCCVTSYHDGVDLETVVRVSLVVTDMSVSRGYKLLDTRDWWVRDMPLDDIHEEVDWLLGRLNDSRTVVLHVDGIAPLTRSPAGGYYSSMVTRSDLLALMREHPEKFGGRELGV